MPPQALHSLHNIDTKLFHAIRLEYKKGFSEEQKSPGQGDD